MSNMDLIRPMQTTLYIRETYKLTRRKPLIIQGMEKPYKPPQQDKKNPILLYLFIAAALQAYSYILSSLDDLNFLKTTASFTRTYSPYLIINYYTIVSCILAIPYTISCLTVAIYTMPPSPLKPIKGVRGIHPF